MKNPFHTTKASYYDDPEILKFWVNPELSDVDFFHTVIEPTESMPIMILGGKGSGKTHILRYFSFNSQTLRAKETNINLLDQVQNDGYIGIYIVSSGLQANRFSGKQHTDEEWKNTFFYYINLELIEKFLKKIYKVLYESNANTEYNLTFLKDYMSIGENLNLSKIELKDLYEYIKEKRIDIDSQLASLRLPGQKNKLNIHPILHHEDGFYSIIDQILLNIEEISNIKILYIIDEYENFNEDQQKYFNTLLRQPSKSPKKVGFRISGRLWSIKTWHTYDDEEILQVNSEVKMIHLEDILKEKYKNFTKKLYRKRVNKEVVDFENSFENYKECIENELNDIYDTHKGKEKKHFKKLKKYLNDNTLFEQIQKELECEENYFLEKLNILLLYKKWNKKNLLEESQLIKKACMEYLDSKGNTYKSQLDKYKTYMIYQLLRDYRRDISYSGYETIVKLSANNPRIFLSVLSNIYKECVYQDKDLFAEKRIACSIQDKAILESSKWFWNNFTEDIKDERVEWAVVKICELFRAIYRSDNPTEKDLVLFTYDESEITTDVRKIIQLAINHSLLIDEGYRKDRNGVKKLRKLRIHPMLSPRWELSVSGGGTFNFKKDEINSLFLKKDIEWKEQEKNILDRYKILKPEVLVEQDAGMNLFNHASTTLEKEKFEIYEVTIQPSNKNKDDDIGELS